MAGVAVLGLSETSLAQRATQDREPAAGAAVRAGQNAGAERVTTQRQVGAAGQQAGLSDEALAAWLIIDNQLEIAASEMAQEKSQSPEVKQFAQQMVQEHTAYLNKLRQIAGPLGQGIKIQGAAGAEGGAAQPGGERSSGGTQGRSAQLNAADGQAAQTATDTEARRASAAVEDGQRAGAAAVRAGGQAGAHGGAGMQLVSLKQELGQQCLATASRELQEAQGPEFDKAYIGMQKGQHLQMLDTLAVFQRHASPQLRPLIEQGIQTTQQHLQHVKTIKQQLDNMPSTARRPAGGEGQQPQQQQQ